MTASTPSTVSRYGPAVLFLTGVSAGYAAYIIYNTLQSSTPSDGLQRSNAVRRRRPRDSAPPPLTLPLSEQDITVLGDYHVLNTRVLLDPHNLITPTELRSIILTAQPDASEETINHLCGRTYEEFFDRLLVVHSPDRALSPAEIDALLAWLNDRNPNNPAVDRDAIVRAATWHAQMFGNVDNFTMDDGESIAPTELSLGSDEDPDDDAIDPEGQTLQRTLYHIAEDRARLEGVIHRGITCNGCDEKPIRGTRWHCANCPDFDLCSNCEATNSHYKNHIFYKIRVPAGYLSLQKQEPIYPGKPHMMNLSIDPALKRRLVAETKMEAEEVEALWDQFTCLAGTEWMDDPNNVGWAIDRRDFNHTFVPRYNSFTAGPNLVYDRIFAYYDADKNGLIGFEEWIKGIDGMHTTDVDVKANILFNGYDIDGDGYISRKDILRIFRAYYSIEKEATRNYIMELSEEVTVRTALDTIRSSQPLGSAFPPRSMNGSNPSNPRLRHKQENGTNTTAPVLEQNTDVAGRDEILRTTDLQHIVPDEVSDEQRANILNRRWARRQYYLDEEEGFTQPDGAGGQSPLSESTQSEGPADTSEEHSRNRSSRSSSRVRFQEDVEQETRSNASSSRPVGERWGGYEIPEPEQDLGKEVLYQVTQQGFNELLNPLFLEKEDMAMDAQNTRSERRTRAADIESTITHLFKAKKPDVEIVLQVGIFRFSKCMVAKFCWALNYGQSNIQNLFINPTHHGLLSENEARAAIETIYDSVEARVLSSVKNPKATNADNMTIWNMFMCQRQLREEAISAVMSCVKSQGWLSLSVPSEGSVSDYRDPTMPQFRPNSLINPPVNSQCGSCSSSETGAASDTDESSIHEDADLGRRFFVCAAQVGLERCPGRQRPTNSVSTPESGSPSTLAVGTGLSQRVLETMPTSNAAEPGGPRSDTVQLNCYADIPDRHVLFIENVEGTHLVRCGSTIISHSTDPYNPEINQVKPLQRSIRQMAINPQSPLHTIMLASLESMDQEINHRKGGGLVSFEEFAEHMRQGQLRFLESWMDWVGI
jgi:Ca2+-binding EF-hand superfamily protein